MTKRRVLLLVVAVVVLLPLLAVGGLLLFFPTERATAYAVAKIEAQTGREVTVGGSSLALVPNVRLALEDVTFGEVAAAGAPRVTVESVELGMKLMPLLSRRVEVTRLAIDAPLVEVVLSEEKAEPEKPRPAASEPAGAELEIRELAITRGRVVVRTADGRPFLEISGLEEHLSASASASGNLSLTGETRVDELVLHVTEGEIGRGLPLSLRKSLRYEAATGRLTVAEASLDMAGVPIALTGYIDDVQGEQLASLELAGGPGRIESILGLLPAGLFPEMEGMESSGMLALDARVSGSLVAPEGPSFAANLSLTDGRIKYPGVPKPIEDITLQLEATPEHVEITELAARSAQSSLRAHATIRDYQTRPVIQLALDTDVDLDDVRTFYPAADSFRLGGHLKAQLVAEGPADDPDAFAINGTVETREMTVAAPALRLPVESLTSTMVFDTQVVTISSATGRIGSSDFALSGRLENPMALDTTRTGLGRARGTFNLRSQHLDLDEMMPEPEAASRGSAGGAPARTSPLAALPPLDGTLTATVGSMRVKELDLTELNGQVTLDHGVMTMKDVTAGVFQGRAAIDGTMTMTDPAKPTFDVTIDATDCNVVDVFSYNRDLGRLATVAEHLTGTMSTKTTMNGALDDTLGLVIDALESDGNVWVQNAHLAGHPVQQGLARFLKSDTVKELGVEEIVQAFTIRDGRLQFDDLSLAAGPFELVGSGWSSIDGRYQMTFDLWLPREIAQNVRDQLPPDLAGLFFAGNEERLMLPVKVAGSREEKVPSVGLDSEKLSADAQARAKARLAAEKQRLADEAKARAEAAAAELLEGAKPDSVPIVEAARGQVEEKVKDKLKGLFGK